MASGHPKSHWRRRGGLHVILRAESPNLYIQGTVRVGERSERVGFSTRLHHELPGAWEAAETIRLKKDKEVLNRVLYNRPPPRPMEELVADYLERPDYSNGVRLIAKDDREGVVSGKGVRVRVALGGGRILKKKS